MIVALNNIFANNPKLFISTLYTKLAFLLNALIHMHYTHLYNWIPPPYYLCTNILNNCYQSKSNGLYSTGLLL